MSELPVIQLIILCAKEETRTPTPEPALPPQSSVSTNFTTFAKVPKTGLEPAHPYGH